MCSKSSSQTPPTDGEEQLDEEIQPYLSEQFASELGGGATAIPVHGSGKGERREALEKRYKSRFSERPDYRQLVTYVPNKKIPVYNWFKFKEGFSRQLVASLTKHMGVRKGAVIYDPFAGSGTTLLACKELGFSGIGSDILPVAVFVSGVKITDWHDRQGLALAVKEFLSIPYSTPSGSLPKIKIIDLAFPQEVQQQILFFKESAERFDQPVRDFLMLGLLTILEEVSRTSKDGQFLRLVEKRIPDVRETLARTLNSMLADLSSLLPEGGGFPGKAEVIHGDAREQCLDGRYHHKVQAVITSPPYLNRYDYSRSYALELCLLNVKSHEDMVLVRHSLLRSHIESREHPHKSIELPALAEILQRLRNRELNNQRIPTMINAYFEDMNMVISNLSLCLKTGGKVALVVANAQFAGENVPTDLMLCELAS